MVAWQSPKLLMGVRISLPVPKSQCQTFSLALFSLVYTVVNNAMVQAYWKIGQKIHKACNENDRAEYGKNY